MALTLCNSYPAKIWTSIMFYSPETCGPDGFEMMGWWALDPGTCAMVYANDLADVNRYWYYYAEARDGTFWAGPVAADVDDDAFGGGYWCHGFGKTHADRTIGYRELDIGSSDDYTLTLIL